MSYKTINACTADVAFAGRLTAAIAQEQKAASQPIDPGSVFAPLSWAVASTSDIEAAYASALAASNPDPGGDEAVITDQQILSAVQANMPPP